MSDISDINTLAGQLEKLSAETKDVFQSLGKREDDILKVIADLEDKVLELEDALQEKEYNDPFTQRQNYRDAYCEGFSDALQTLEYLIENEKTAADVAHAKMYSHYQLKLQMWKIGDDEKDINPPAFKQIVLT